MKGIVWRAKGSREENREEISEGRRIEGELIWWDK